jgi:hypothetical protein
MELQDMAGASTVNLRNTLKKIRACENEVAAQLLFETFIKQEIQNYFYDLPRCLDNEDSLELAKDLIRSIIRPQNTP